MFHEQTLITSVDTTGVNCNEESMSEQLDGWIAGLNPIWGVEATSPAALIIPPFKLLVGDCRTKLLKSIAGTNMG